MHLAEASDKCTTAKQICKPCPDACCDDHEHAGCVKRVQYVHAVPYCMRLAAAKPDMPTPLGP